MQEGKAVGISISNNFLRVLEIEREKDKVSIDKILEVPLPKENSPKEQKKLSHTIKTTLVKEKFLRRAFISMADSDIVVRTKTVPPIKKEEIFKLIESEIKDYAIFGRSNVSIGFSTTNKEKDKFDIVWAGVKEEKLFKTLKFIRSAGVKTYGVIPNDFALAESVYTLYNEESPVAILNVDAETTRLIISKGKKLLFVYIQDIGTSSLLGDDSSSQSAWTGNILTTLTYATRNVHIAVKEVFLVTQTDGSSKMLELLSSRLPYPIIIPNLLEKLECNREEDYLALQGERGVNFIAALGLALLSLDKKDNPLFCDISKHILREKQSTSIKIIVMIILLAIINGGGYYAYPYVNGMLNKVETNVKNTETKIQQLSKAAEDTNKLKSELANSKKELSLYQVAIKTAENRVITSALLIELRAKQPDGLHVASISVGGSGAIRMSGTGSSYRNVLDFEENLATAKYIKGATILSMSKSGKGSVSFQMTAAVRGVSNGKK